MNKKEEQRAEFYRKRAEELTAIATTTRGAAARLALLSMARGYRSMAQTIAHLGSLAGTSSNWTPQRTVESQKQEA